MKRVIVSAILSCLILLVFVSSFTSAIWVTSGDGFTRTSAITSYATSQLMDFRVRVIGTPTLVIHEPGNGTYLINESVALNYSTSDDTEMAWYVIDGGSPVAISPNSSLVYFNASEGSHTIWVYANNSYNLTAKNTTFYLNATRFTILYRNDYKTTYSGASTDFYRHSFEELQNLSGIILENIFYGKIRFDVRVNVTNDRNISDRSVNLENNTEISFNKIGLNRDELPNFNVSATLWLYNLSFTNPRVLKDGVVCQYYACPIEDYTDGIFRFKVRGFSNYSAEETPEAQTIVIGGGGGGGGTRTIYVNTTNYINVSSESDSGKYFCGLVINETNANESNVYCGRCNAPYMTRGTDCCLDADSNKVCDADEKSETGGPQASSLSTRATFNLPMSIITAPFSILDLFLGAVTLVLLIILIIFLRRSKRSHSVKKTYVRIR